MELKPCPFCGSTDLDSAVEDDPRACGQGWLISCGSRDCGCSVGGWTKEDAISSWNRRAPLDLEEIIALIERVPLESFASDSYIKQTAHNRQQIIDAIRAIGKP